jgi:hypothetical protein
MKPPVSNAVYLDHGYWMISAYMARKLCKASGSGTNTNLPRDGWAKLVEHEGKWYFIGRTPHQGESVWSMYSAGNWRMVDGRMVM